MAPFYGWGSTASRLEPLRGGSLLENRKEDVFVAYHSIFISIIPSKQSLLIHDFFSFKKCYLDTTGKFKLH